MTKTLHWLRLFRRPKYQAGRPIRRSPRHSKAFRRKIPSDSSTTSGAHASRSPPLVCGSVSNAVDLSVRSQIDEIAIPSSFASTAGDVSRGRQFLRIREQWDRAQRTVARTLSLCTLQQVSRNPNPVVGHHERRGVPPTASREC